MLTKGVSGEQVNVGLGLKIKPYVSKRKADAFTARPSRVCYPLGPPPPLASFSCVAGLVLGPQPPTNPLSCRRSFAAALHRIAGRPSVAESSPPRTGVSWVKQRRELQLSGARKRRCIHGAVPCSRREIRRLDPIGRKRRTGPSSRWPALDCLLLFRDPTPGARQATSAG
eukprot:751310-Hanusia_phi.AAC.1